MINTNEVIALGIVLTVLDIVIVGLRFHIKRTRVNGIGIDDVLILLSLVCLCGTAGVILYGATTQGYGKFYSPATAVGVDKAAVAEEMSISRHLTWSFVCIAPWTYGLAKLSVLFWYRSIFVGRTFNILSMSLIVLVGVWIFTTFFTIIFQCGSHIWVIWTNSKTVEKHCLSGFADGVAVATTDVFTDLLILILPIYWVSKLHLPLRKRLSVMAVFFFGALTIASSVIRLVAVSLVYPGHNTNPNQYGYMTTLIFFGQLEAGMCVIAASLPTLGPLLFKRRAHKSSSSTQGESKIFSRFAPRFWFSSLRSSRGATDPSGVPMSNTTQAKGEIMVTKSYHVQAQSP